MANPMPRAAPVIAMVLPRIVSLVVLTRKNFTGVKSGAGRGESTCTNARPDRALLLGATTARGAMAVNSLVIRSIGSHNAARCRSDCGVSAQQPAPQQQPRAIEPRHRAMPGQHDLGLDLFEHDWPTHPA